MSSWLTHRMRAGRRLLWLAAELVVALVAYARAWTTRSGSLPRKIQSQWLQRTARRLLKVFGVELTVMGPVPQEGLLVCNHLGYLDVLILGALAPSTFVAKAEVEKWLLFGWFARLGGTLFVDRNRRLHSRHTAERIGSALGAGALVVLFPEGTSSGGEEVLPFKSSLLEPIARERHRVTAGHIRYNLPDGNASEEVCYWRDMTLVPHLINLLSKRKIQADVAFDSIHECSSDRKNLARLLHSEVIRLRQECSSSEIPGHSPFFQRSSLRTKSRQIYARSPRIRLAP